MCLGDLQHGHPKSAETRPSAGRGLVGVLYGEACEARHGQRRPGCQALRLPGCQAARVTAEIWAGHGCAMPPSIAARLDRLPAASKLLHTRPFQL